MLVWDLEHLVTERASIAAALPEPALIALWAALADPCPTEARRAIETLLDVPDQAVNLLSTRLAPARGPDAKQLAAWITDLGSDDFELRREADQALDHLGDTAAPALRQALQRMSR